MEIFQILWSQQAKLGAINGLPLGRKFCSEGGLADSRLNFPESAFPDGALLFSNKLEEFACLYKKINDFTNEVDSASKKPSDGPDNFEDVNPGIESDCIGNMSGLYVQAFCQGISIAIADVYMRLHDIEEYAKKDSHYSVTSLAVEIDPFLYVFKAISDAIDKIIKLKIRGCFILDLCQSYLNHGAEPVQMAFQKIHRACLEPFFLQTNTWILSAKLFDPFLEYFIKKLPKEDSNHFDDTESVTTVSSCDLTEAFESGNNTPIYSVALDRLPTFLPYSVASRMLFIGEMMLICKRDRHSNEPLDETLELCGLNISELSAKLNKLEHQTNFSVNQFDNAITEIWASLNKYARKLADDAGVKSKILQMKDIYLFGRGELWMEFINRSNIYLNSDAAVVKSRYFKIEFDNALYYVYLTDDYDLSKIVDFKLPRKENLKGEKARHVLEIVTKVAWPLNSIFTPEVMSNYNVIFRFLLNLRKSVMALHKSWLLINKLPNLQVQFKFVEIRNFLIALMSNLENYCLTHVIANRMSWLNDMIDNSNTYTEINSVLLEFQRSVLSQLFLTREDDAGNNAAELEMTEDVKTICENGVQESSSGLVRIAKQVRSCLRSLFVLGEKFSLLAEQASVELNESHMDMLNSLETRLIEKIQVLFKLSHISHDSSPSSTSHIDQLIVCLDCNKFFRGKYCSKNV